MAIPKARDHVLSGLYVLSGKARAAGGSAQISLNGQTGIREDGLTTLDPPDVYSSIAVVDKIWLLSFLCDS